MIATFHAYRSFSRPARLLMLNQYGINAGFYMLMPFLAEHLASGLGLAGGLIGLILGARNLSQQGMFAVGGALADRYGAKPLIVAGCVLRTVGFATLGLVDSVPGLLAGAAATGAAGALFNPAVRTYLAAEAGERRVEAFACFNVFYQTGTLTGPVIGLALTLWDFRVTSLTAATVFALLTIAQLRALPHRQAAEAKRDRITAGWRQALSNRRFMYFAVVMAAAYLLSFQVYLTLPLALRKAGLDATDVAITTAAMFGCFGLITVVCQVRLAGWYRKRWSRGRTLTTGLALMSSGFAWPILAEASSGDNRTVVTVAAVVACGITITVATMFTFPIEMDTIVTLSGNSHVGSHYGIHQTVAGIGITVGNIATGALLDTNPVLPWLGLVSIGAVATVAAAVLLRSSDAVERTPQAEPATAGKG